MEHNSIVQIRWYAIVPRRRLTSPARRSSIIPLFWRARSSSRPRFQNNKKLPCVQTRRVSPSTDGNKRHQMSHYANASGQLSSLVGAVKKIPRNIFHHIESGSSASCEEE